VLAIFPENGFACRNITKEAIEFVTSSRFFTTGAVIAKSYG
jgi:hypothetical protein